MTEKAIIEVKKTYNAWTPSNRKSVQTDKFADRMNENYFNPYKKQAILYVDEPLTVVQMEKIYLLVA